MSTISGREKWGLLLLSFMEYNIGYSDSSVKDAYLQRISERVKNSLYGGDNTDSGSGERDQYGFRRQERGDYSSGGGSPAIEIPVQPSTSFSVGF